MAGAWLTLTFAPDAAACAIAPPDRAAVTPGAEQALVVWDAASKREHFVRTVAFDTDAKDFGFLVPTPTVPELGEVPADLFDRLEPLIRPELIDGDPETRVVWGCAHALVFTTRGAAKSAPEGGVHVLATARVAGFDAVVLEADTRAALEGWLAAHRYPLRPELAAWLDAYVAQRWKITAFRVAGAEGLEGAAPGRRDTLRPRAIRMTFRTERPFFPYREPEPPPSSARRPGRAFALFLVTDERMDGRLGARAESPWGARLLYADEPAELGSIIGPALPRGDVVPKRLHAFLESVEQRPSADLTFVRSTSQATLRPPPIVVPRRTRTLFVPLEVVPVAAIAALLLRRRGRERRG